MKLVIALLVLILGLGGVVYYANSGKAPEGAGGSDGAGTSAPSANGVVMSAADFKLENYRGSVVVMDFWATWCGPCKMAMPGVQKIHERFAGRPVRVFGMDCWERGGDPAAYMKSQGYTYGLVTGTDAIATGYGVTGIPHFVVIGVKGETLMTQVGYDPSNEERIGAVIEEHLKKNNL
jgi:thiol-disulfide isomerase/thioredoxin